MEDNSRIIRTEYSEEMQKSFINYAMSVIIARALPDIRDGLKPVQRRTLYDMYELGIRYDRPYRKCARIVGDTMGKYHPHGDSSIYGALVNLAQEWNTRYPLVTTALYIRAHWKTRHPLLAMTTRQKLSVNFQEVLPSVKIQSVSSRVS